MPNMCWRYKFRVGIHRQIPWDVDGEYGILQMVVKNKSQKGNWIVMVEVSFIRVS